MLTPDAADAIPVKLMNGDTIVAVTFGYVSNLEIATFTKEPEVQITIACTEPYFSSPDPVTLVPNTKSAFIIPNEGSAPTGFEVEVTFASARSTWTVQGLGIEKMTFDYAFLSGDKLKFNTNPGRRFIEVVRGGNTTNIVHSLSPESVWLMLRGGDNAFTTDKQIFDWNFISYKPKYWG